MVLAVKFCLFVFNQYDKTCQTVLYLNSNSVTFKHFYFGHVTLFLEASVLSAKRVVVRNKDDLSKSVPGTA